MSTSAVGTSWSYQSTEMAQSPRDDSDDDREIILGSVEVVGGSPLLPRIMLRYHPDDPYLPPAISGKVDCTYNVGPFLLHGVSYTKVEYAFNYVANGAIGFGYCCFPKSECLGYHDGDRERLMFLLSPDLQSVEWVWFNAHSPGQGVWRSWNETRKTSEGNMIAYVARASHAFYPEDGVWPRGVWPRAGCFANDLCSDGGPAYEAVPSGTHTDTVNPKQASITWWERLCICCYASHLRNDTP